LTRPHKEVPPLGRPQWRPGVSEGSTEKLYGGAWNEAKKKIDQD